MRRGTMPGQGGNVCDLGRPPRQRSCHGSNHRHFSENFHDTAEAKINAIAEWHPWPVF